MRIDWREQIINGSRTSRGIARLIIERMVDTEVAASVAHVEADPAGWRGVNLIEVC